MMLGKLTMSLYKIPPHCPISCLLPHSQYDSVNDINFKTGNLRVWKPTKIGNSSVYFSYM